MLSVIHTAVKKLIEKMELTTSKPLIQYRILMLNISWTAKKQGQKWYNVAEHERGYNGMKCKSDSCSPWRQGNSCHLMPRLIDKRLPDCSTEPLPVEPHKPTNSWLVGPEHEEAFKEIVGRVNTQNPLLLCLASNRQTTYEWGNLLKRWYGKS